MLSEKYIVRIWKERIIGGDNAKIPNLEEVNLIIVEI